MVNAIAEFKKLADLWFVVKEIPPEERHNYIILWLGGEGVRLLNTRGLTDAQLQVPKNVWDELEGIQPSDNFRIHRLELQRHKQKHDETFDDFYSRCKLKAMQCKLATPALRVERIIEQLTAGIRYPEVQCLLLSRDEKLTLMEALQIAKTHEASSKHMGQIDLGAPRVDAIRSSNQRTTSHSRCGNCGGSHPPGLT